MLISCELAIKIGFQMTNTYIEVINEYLQA